jgi:hypothetical protein
MDEFAGIGVLGIAGERWCGVEAVRAVDAAVVADDELEVLGHPGVEFQCGYTWIGERV